MEQQHRFLNPPAVKSVRYQRNFIKTAVCELRFPTLLELEAKPPREFQRAIRKTYPFYEGQVLDQFAGAGADEVAREHHYLFRSKDKHWTVALKSFAISLETAKYLDFEDFYGRLKQILDSARGLIDADFFTRVGLRYINSIPIDDGDVKGWVRPELLAMVTNDVLGTADKYQSLYQGWMEQGQFSIRHGLRQDAQKKAPDGMTYFLDFDYFIEGVDFRDVDAIIRKFHSTNFSLFSWCLGDKAKNLLGKGKPK